MANASPLISSLNSGEFSPRMDARVDFDRYPNAAKMLRNFILYPQGGITRRPGTRFIKEVKDSSDITSILPFRFSQDQAYVVEVGDLYMRFYRRQARLAVDDTNAVVTNGEFGSNITDWDDKSTGSAAIAHDATGLRLQLTGASGSIAWAEQDIAVSAGNADNDHVLQFKIEGYGGGTVHLQIGSATITSDILTEVELGVGTHAIAFNPGGNTTFYVQFRNKNIPIRNMFIDDIALIDDAPVEVVSPYTSAEIADIEVRQTADVVYLLHSDHPVRRLERRGHKSWSIVEAFFEDGPYDDENPNFSEDRHQIATNQLFENGLEGWVDGTNNGGRVTHSADTFIVSLDNDTGGSSESAWIEQTITVDANKVHIIHALTLNVDDVKISVGSSPGGAQYLNKTSTDTVPIGWNSWEFTPTGTTIYVRFRFDTNRDNGLAGVGASLIYNEDARFMQPSGTDGEVTVTAVGHTPFLSSDVGRLIRLRWPGREPGYGVITAFTSTTVVTVLVLRRFPSTAPTERWKLGVWNSVDGYPTTVGFFDGRAVFANSTEHPNRLWFSQSAEKQNMRKDSFVEGVITVEDDDAIDLTLESDEIDPIVWINGQKSLVVGTAGGQWIIDSSGSVITPGDRSAKQHTALPSAQIPPSGVNQTTIFADNSKRELHEIGFKFEQDSFVSTDLTILADHILKSPVLQLSYQRRPYSTVWARRTDGRLAALSYNSQHEVLGWAQIIIGGAFGSGDAQVVGMATIPGVVDSSQVNNSDERDELWLVVKRTVNGQTVQYIEIMEYFYDGPLREDYTTEALWRTAVRESQEDCFFVDSGITYNSTATTTITGLDHLEGQTVKVLADGFVIADKTVASGQITLTTAASKVHAGLAFKHRYESLKISVGNPSGTAVNKVKALTGVGMVVLDTGSFEMTTVEYDPDGRKIHELYTINFYRDWEDPDLAVPLFTGEWYEETEADFTGDVRIYAEGNKPLPFTLIGLAPKVSTVDSAPSNR